MRGTLEEERRWSLRKPLRRFALSPGLRLAAGVWTYLEFEVSRSLAKPARSTPEAFCRLAGGKRRRTRRHRLQVHTNVVPRRGTVGSANAKPEIEFDVRFLW